MRTVIQFILLFSLVIQLPSLFGQSNCDCFEIQKVIIPKDSTELFQIMLSDVNCEHGYLNFYIIDLSSKDTLLQTECSCLVINKDFVNFNFGYETEFPPLTINYDPSQQENIDSVIIEIKGSYNCSEIVSTKTTTATFNIEVPKILIYPNPTSNYVSIKIDKDIIEEINHVEVIDIRGKLVKLERVKEINTNINFNDLENGIYYLKISGRNRIIHTIKIIKI